MSLGSYSITDHDDDLALRVSLFLSGRNRPALRNLEISARGGTVLLRGRVSSFHHKQLAIEFTRRVAGVLRIVDELHVEPSSPPGISTPDASAMRVPLSPAPVATLAPLALA